MDPKANLIWNLLYSSQQGNYLQSFDYAVTLAYVTKSATVLERLESIRRGVEIKPGIRIPFTYLIHQYARMRDDNLRRKIKLETGGRTKQKVSVGEILEGIRFVNRIVLISCFEVMEEQKIDVDITNLYKTDPSRDSI
jgi:hypothetical protein